MFSEIMVQYNERFGLLQWWRARAVEWLPGGYRSKTQTLTHAKKTRAYAGSIGAH